MASQVVFIDGFLAKQHYRKYKIRSASIQSGPQRRFHGDGGDHAKALPALGPVKAEGADLGALRHTGGSALQTDGLNDWPDVMIDGVRPAFGRDGGATRAQSSRGSERLFTRQATGRNLSAW